MTGRPSELREALLRKTAESASVQARFFDENADRIVSCAGAMARAFERGARLFTMGNGGGATDAEHLAVEFAHPIFEKRRRLPAQALTRDVAWLTAVGNDEDFSMTFARQLGLCAREGDIALGISTSGQSRNVLRAMRTARELRLLTIGFAGRDGGALADGVDFAFVVRSFSTHRIQEAHGTLLHVLWDLVHLSLGEEDTL